MYKVPKLTLLSGIPVLKATRQAAIPSGPQAQLGCRSNPGQQGVVFGSA